METLAAMETIYYRILLLILIVA